MAGNVPEFTDANFQAEVLDSDKPVVVDLWADWCAPCRAIAPTIEALSAELAESIKIGKLDITANPDTPPKYGVTAIPTILLFQNGEVVDRIVGGGKTKDAFKTAFAKAFSLAL